MSSAKQKQSSSVAQPPIPSGPPPPHAYAEKIDSELVPYLLKYVYESGFKEKEDRRGLGLPLNSGIFMGRIARSYDGKEWEVIDKDGRRIVEGEGL